MTNNERKYYSYILHSIVIEKENLSCLNPGTATQGYLRAKPLAADLGKESLERDQYNINVFFPCNF